MRELNNKQVMGIVREVLKEETYKKEFDNPYYRGVTKMMLRDTVELTEKTLVIKEVDKREQLLAALKMAYRKHHLGDESIGWDELSEQMLNALCEVMGDRNFQEWIEREKENE